MSDPVKAMHDKMAADADKAAIEAVATLERLNPIEAARYRLANRALIARGNELRSAGSAPAPAPSAPSPQRLEWERMKQAGDVVGASRYLLIHRNAIYGGGR